MVDMRADPLRGLLAVVLGLALIGLTGLFLIALTARLRQQSRAARTS